jgi:hypothetical protein
LNNNLQRRPSSNEKQRTSSIDAQKGKNKNNEEFKYSS